MVSLALTVAMGCGSDAIIIFRTNLGTVDANATCGAHGGQFPLREQNGLVIVVILDDSSSVLLANGIQGSCSNVTAGSQASVSGKQENGALHATQVRLLGG